METPQVTHNPAAAWVIGGAGFLGSALVNRLRGAGTRVLSLDMVGQADVLGDVACEEVLRCAATRLTPTVIFCCQATHGGDAASFKHCYEDVARLLVSFFPTAHIVWCSSTSVYGKLNGVVDEEAEPLHPSARASILLEAEQRILQQGGAVARLVPLFGSGRCELLRRHLASLPSLPGDDSRWLNYLHVDDAAEALMLLASHSGLYTVCGENCKKGEAYALLERLTGIPRCQETSEASSRGVSHRYVPSERIRSLGWCPKLSLEGYIKSVI